MKRAALAGAGLVAVLALGTGVASSTLLTELFDEELFLLVAFALGLAGHYVAHLTRGTLSGNGRFGAYGILLGSEGVLRLFGCMLLALIGVRAAGPYGLALGMAPIAASLVALRGQKGLVSPGPEAPWPELSVALGYLVGGSFLAQLLVNAGPLAVKVLASSSEQDAASRFLASLVIARIPLFMFQAIQGSLLPKLAGLAASGRQTDFRRGLNRLLAVVCGVAVIAVLGSWAIGPWVVETLFGAQFVLGRSDLALLSAGSAAYMIALTFAQALIALAGYPRIVIGWLLGLLVFAAIVTVEEQLLLRVEVAFLTASFVSAGTLGIFTMRSMKRLDVRFESSRRSREVDHFRS